MADSGGRVCAAIDFGTAYSGIAFSLPGDESEIKVMKTWPNTDRFKTSTSLLLDKDMKLIAFGDDAQVKFYDMEPEETEDVLFFEKFKMMLMEGETTGKLKAGIEIPAHNGVRKPAMDVIAIALRHMKQVFEKVMVKSHAVKQDNVLWLITVPAIWNEAAKDFMRQAAYKGGLVSRERPDDLIIALEPEAAGLFCKKQTVMGFAGTRKGDFATLEKGDQYIIVDAGGGTVDIAVHELQADGNVHELYQPSGKDWGGNNVNVAFYKIFKDIFGGKFVDEMRKIDSAGMAEFDHKFEVGKKNWGHDDPNPVIRVPAPAEFVQSYYGKLKEQGKASEPSAQKEVQKTLEAYNEEHGTDIKYVQGNFRIEQKMCVKLFSESMLPMEAHIRKMVELESLRGVRRAFLVGGFSECKYLQQRLKAIFEPKNIQVLVPNEASTSVMKGAVMFGKNPSVITARIARFTYGVECTSVYDPEVHKGRTPEMEDGENRVDKCFSKCSTAGETIKLNDERPQSFGYSGMTEGEKIPVSIKVYRSTKREVVFTDEPGCTHIGTVNFTIPEGADLTKGCEVYFNFAKTELKVTGKDLSTGVSGNTEIRYLDED